MQIKDVTVSPIVLMYCSTLAHKIGPILKILAIAWHNKIARERGRQVPVSRLSSV